MSIDSHDIHWQFAANLRSILSESGELPLEKWRREECLRVVKKACHRAVYHVQLPGLSFYLKHYPKSDVRAWFRQLVRPSKARIEFDKAVEIAKRGIATVEPLAIGERASWLGSGESYLITRELENTLPLNEFLDQRFPLIDLQKQAALRRRLATSLGTFLAQLHDAGICHDDLHAGNLLLRFAPADEPTLFLIDLHAVRLGDRLDWAASCENLVLLNRWFSVFAERSDRGRFWKAYCRARAKYADDDHSRDWLKLPFIRSRARELELATWESNLLFWHRRDARCLTSNRYFQPVRTAMCRGFAVMNLDADFLQGLSNDPDMPFTQQTNRILKDSRSSTVIEMQAPINGELRPVIFKRVNPKKWGDGWKSLTGRSGLWRSWIMGHGLLHRALPTAKPLAVIHTHKNRLPHRGYLLMEKIGDAVSLHEFVSEWRHTPPSDIRPLKYALLTRLASMIRLMHRCRLSHRDLKAVNILVRTNQNEAPQLWFIDLEGVRRWSNPLPHRRRINDLARLNCSFLELAAVTNSDRLRFLRLYLECAWKGRSNWKQWWREIEKATQQKIKQNRKRNRPLM